MVSGSARWRHTGRGPRAVMMFLVALLGALLLLLAGGGDRAGDRSALERPLAESASAGAGGVESGAASAGGRGDPFAERGTDGGARSRQALGTTDSRGGAGAPVRAGLGDDRRSPDSASDAALVVELVNALGGGPVVGALIRDPSDPTSPRARSDERGRVRLRLPSGAAEQLLVSHPGFVDRSVALPARDEKLRVELVPSAELAIRWDASESGRAEVSLWSVPSADRADWSLVRAAWEGEGQARFTDLDPSTYLALGGFELGVGEGPSSVELAPGEQAELELRILAPASIIGRARFDDGSPIADAEVRAAPVDGRVPTVVREQLARSARTDLDGRFELNGLGRGLHRLRLNSAGGATAMLEVELAAAAPTGPVELVCPTPMRLRGTVVDLRGAPIQGAAIAHASGRKGAPAPTASAVAAMMGAVTSGADGSFEVAVSWAESNGFLLAAPPPGRDDLSPAAVAWTAEHALSGALLTVRLEARVELEGEVRDARSHALLPGASVEARLQPGARAQALSATVADGGGRFVLEELPRLPLVLLVRAPGYRTERVVIPAAEGEPQTTGPLAISLSPAAPLAVSLFDDAGDAVAGVDLCARALDDPGARWWAQTDVRGRAEFAALPLARLGLELGGERWEWAGSAPGPFQHSGPADRVLEVRLRRHPEGAVVEAAVVGSDGSAVAGLQVLGAEGALVVREGDRLRIEGLDPEVDELWFSGSEHAAKRVRLPELAVGRVESLGRIELAPTVEVRVEVLRRDGSAVSGAQVRLLGAEGSVGGLGRDLPPLLLEQRGAGQYRGRAQRGTWRLQVRSADLLAPIQIVRVDPSGTGEPLSRTVVVDG